MALNIQFPTLRKAAAGTLGTGDIRTDAIGRRMLRTDQERNQAGSFVRQGGTPQPRGPEVYTPALLQAAARLRLPANRATGPRVMEAIRQVPNAKGGLFGLSPQEYQVYLPETKGRQPSDPRLQALAGLRKLMNNGRV